MNSLELVVDGDLGAMDAGRSLRVLMLLADVALAVAPEGAILPLAGLRSGSAVATITPDTVTVGELAERIGQAFEDPARLSRGLRTELSEAFRTRVEFGIRDFGYRVGPAPMPFDDATHRRMLDSLRRPVTYTSVTGEVRGIGRTSRGVSGRITNRVDGRVVHFDASNDLADVWREAIFRRATLFGAAEVAEGGGVTRIQVERVEVIGSFARLTDCDLDDLPFDAAATDAALRELRDG